MAVDAPVKDHALTRQRLKLIKESAVAYDDVFLVVGIEGPEHIQLFRLFSSITSTSVLVNTPDQPP